VQTAAAVVDEFQKMKITCISRWRSLAQRGPTGGDDSVVTSNAPVSMLPARLIRTNTRYGQALAIVAPSWVSAAANPGYDVATLSASSIVVGPSATSAATAAAIAIR